MAKRCYPIVALVSHLPVAHGATAFDVHQDAASVNLAPVPPLVCEAHVVLVLVLDESVPGDDGMGRGRMRSTPKTYFVLEYNPEYKECSRDGNTRLTKKHDNSVFPC